jgi:hypothetical protein
MPTPVITSTSFAMGDVGKVWYYARQRIADHIGKYIADSNFSIACSITAADSDGRRSLLVQKGYTAGSSAVEDDDYYLFLWDTGSFPYATDVGLCCSIAGVTGIAVIDAYMTSNPNPSPGAGFAEFDSAMDALESAMRPIMDGYLETTYGYTAAFTAGGKTYRARVYVYGGFQAPAIITCTLWYFNINLSPGSSGYMNTQSPSGQNMVSSTSVNDTLGLQNALNQLAFRNYTLNLNNGQTIFSVDGTITE